MGKHRRIVQAKAPDQRKPYAFAWRHYLPVAVILLATAAVYAQVFTFEFSQLDDFDYVMGNGFVRAGLTAQDIAWAFTTYHGATWQPLTWISLMLDCQLFGPNPGAHHGVNLLLHLLNVLLLFVVLRRMTGSIWRSAFVAGLFALHPLHVESVAWIAERKDVLSTLLWMLAMLAYANYAEKPTLRRYLLVFAALALGLMAKPMLVSLPLVLLLLDYWPLRRTDLGWKRLVLEKTPMLAVVALSCMVTFIAQQRGGALSQLSNLPVSVRAANAVVAYATYLRKMVVPTDLCCMYQHPGTTLPVSIVVISGLILVAFTAAAVAARRRAPYVLVGWLLYIITLVPVIGLIQVGLHGMADRFTYIPLIGIFVAIAWLAPELVGKYARRTSGIALGVVGGAMLVALSLLTFHQVQTWRDGESVADQIVKVSHGSVEACLIKSGQYGSRGRTDLAERELADALRKHPRVPQLLNAHANLLKMLGRYAEAEREYLEAIRLQPGFAIATSQLGLLYLASGSPDRAHYYCSKAVEISPLTASLHVNLAAVYADMQRADAAIDEYERAIALQPELDEAQYQLSLLLFRKGDMDGAIEHLRLAVHMNPDSAQHHFGLGSVLRARGFTTEAIDEFSEVVRLQPDWGEAHATLAQALSDAGRTAEATREAELAKECGCKVPVRISR